MCGFLVCSLSPDLPLVEGNRGLLVRGADEKVQDHMEAGGIDGVCSPTYRMVESILHNGIPSEQDDTWDLDKGRFTRDRIHVALGDGELNEERTMFLEERLHSVLAVIMRIG